MAVDERNFRSTYYEKVGFKSVEEKRSLEILLKDEHFDISKVKQFCLRFGVPVTYKNLVWKLLLGILPVHVKCHNFVMSQRKEEYLNLVHALTIMRTANNSPKVNVFVAAWLLQAGELKFHLNFDEHKSFILIVRSLMFFFDNDADIFWIAKTFYDQINRFRPETGRLIEASHGLLEREDQQLFKHLTDIDVLDNLPFEEWFYCCFAGILNDAALGKIWDKVCGGSYKILIYVAIVILTSLKHRLLACKDLNCSLKYINTISEEVADVIANKSIELWQKQGSPLTVYDKPKP